MRRRYNVALALCRAVGRDGVILKPKPLNWYEQSSLTLLPTLLPGALYQTTVIRFLFHHFVVKHGREPINAAFNFDRDLAADRSFAAGIILFGLFIPMIIFGWSIWGSGMRVT